MAAGILLVPDGHMALGIGELVVLHTLPDYQGPGLLGFLNEYVGLLPPFFNKITAQPEVALLARGLVELDQCQLDFGVAAIAPDLACLNSKSGFNQVGKAAGDVENPPFARRLEIRDGALNEMSGAIELVRLPEVGPAPARLLHREIGVEVAVRLLGLLKQLNGLVGNLLQFRVPGTAQAKPNGLQPFRNVRILKNIAIKIPFLQSR